MIIFFILNIKIWHVHFRLFTLPTNFDHRNIWYTKLRGIGKILSGCQAICFHKTLIEIIKRLYFKNESCQHGASARGLVSSRRDKKPSKMHIANVKSECDINSVLLSNFWSVYEIWCIVCLVHIHFHIRTEQIIANDAKKTPRRYESNVFKTMLRLSKRREEKTSNEWPAYSVKVQWHQFDKMTMTLSKRWHNHNYTREKAKQHEKSTQANTQQSKANQGKPTKAKPSKPDKPSPIK